MKNHQKPGLKPFLAPENRYLDHFLLYFYNIDPILTGFRGPYGKILARGRRIDRASARSIR